MTVVGRSREQLRSISTGVSAAVPSVVGAVASGRTLSPWGIVVGVLLVVLLYLLLSRSNLASQAVAGVLSAARWVVSPQPLPF